MSDLSLISRLAQAIQSGHTGSDVDHARGLCFAAIRACDASGVAYPIVASAVAGPFSQPRTPAATIIEQYSAAWAVAVDGRARTLAQCQAQVVACVKALDEAGAGGEAAPTSSPWPPKGATFASRWDAGNITDGGKFSSTPWNFQSASPAVAPSPVRAGGRALRIAFAGEGKQTPAAGATASDYARRCEVEPAIPKVQAGDTRWVRYEVLLEPGFPVDTATWLVMGQFKQGPSGSPPVELVVERGQWKLVRHGTSSNVLGVHALGPAVAGRVQQVVWGVTFGAGTSGSVGAAVDGVRVRDVAATTWNDQGELYLKTGMYADKALSGAMGVVFDGIAVGPTFASVTP